MTKAYALSELLNAVKDLINDADNSQELITVSQESLVNLELAYETYLEKH